MDRSGRLAGCLAHAAFSSISPDLQRYHMHAPSLWHFPNVQLASFLEEVRLKMSSKKRSVCVVLLSLVTLLPAAGSWLSDVTGINIDLQKKIGQPVMLNAATQPTAIIKEPSPVVPTLMATADQKIRLQQQLDRAADDFRRRSEQYDSYATGFAVMAILLAMSSALAGFMRRPILAGAFSIIVVATTGIPKALPINDRAVFYRELYGQVAGLQVDTALKQDLSVAEFNSRVGQFTTILLYGSKLPGIGETAGVTDELIKDIQTKAAGKG
jgi:hypothetical protein